MKILILLCTVGGILGDIYVDEGYPYDDGELQVNDRILSPPIAVGQAPPMHTRVYYPDDANSTQVDRYGVFYFVTGFGGFSPPNLYTDYFSRIAAHGYVVLGSWPMIPDGPITEVNFTAQAHLQNIEYLKENLPIRIRQKADFSHMALGCHSAGCGPTYNMAKLDPDLYEAVVNMEPVSSAILGGVDFEVPALMLGAELANNSCSYTGVDFETFYDRWTCPKVMFEVADVGHCGILDQFWWEKCRDWRFCRVEEESMLPAYRALTQGVTVAFMNAYLQGSTDMLDYVQYPENIPMNLLQHKEDFEC